MNRAGCGIGVSIMGMLFRVVRAVFTDWVQELETTLL